MKGSLLGSIRTVKHSNVIYAIGSRVTLGCIDNSKQDESSLRVIESIACRTFANIRIAILREKICGLRNFFSTLSVYVGDGDACYLITNRKQLCICLAGENIWISKGDILPRKRIELEIENLIETVKIEKTVYNNAADSAETEQDMVFNNCLVAVFNNKVTVKNMELNIPEMSESNLTRCNVQEDKTYTDSQYIYGINSCKKRIGSPFFDSKYQSKFIIEETKNETNNTLLCFRKKIIKRMTGTKDGSVDKVHAEGEATHKGIKGSPEQVKLNKLKTIKGKTFFKLNINEIKSQRERIKRNTFLENKLSRENKELTLCPAVNCKINKLKLHLGNLYPEMDRSREIVLAGLKIRGVLAMFMEYLKQLHPSNRTYEAWKVTKAGLENLGITSHEVTTVINHTYYILGEENYSQKCQELFLTTAETPTDEIDSLIIQHMEENMPNLRVKTKGEIKKFNEPREDRRSTETRYSNEPGSSNHQYRDHRIHSSGEDLRYLNPDPNPSRSAAPQGGSQQPKISKNNRREGSFRTVDENKVIDSIAKFLTKRSIDEINYSNPPHVIMRDHLHNYPGEITTIPTQWWHKNNGTRVDVMLLNLHYGCSSYYWRDILVSPYNPLALVGETLLCNLRPFYFLCMLWAVAKANHNYREQLRKMLSIREARNTIKEIMKYNKHWTVKAWHPRSMENALEIFVNPEGNAEIREKFLYEEPLVTPRLHQNREPTFVDGTVPQIKEDLITGFTHLDIFIGAERIQTYDKKEMLVLGSEYRTKIIRTWVRTIDKKLGLKDGKKMQERSRSKERRRSRDRRSSTSSKSEKRNHKKETKSNSSERNRHESGYHSRSRERRESKDSTRSKSEDKNRKKEKTT